MYASCVVCVPCVRGVCRVCVFRCVRVQMVNLFAEYKMVGMDVAPDLELSAT